MVVFIKRVAGGDIIPDAFPQLSDACAPVRGNGEFTVPLEIFLQF